MPICVEGRQRNGQTIEDDAYRMYAKHHTCNEWRVKCYDIRVGRFKRDIISRAVRRCIAPLITHLVTSSCLIFCLLIFFVFCSGFVRFSPIASRHCNHSWPACTMRERIEGEIGNRHQSWMRDRNVMRDATARNRGREIEEDGSRAEWDAQIAHQSRPTC